MTIASSWVGPRGIAASWGMPAHAGPCTWANRPTASSEYANTTILVTDAPNGPRFFICEETATGSGTYAWKYRDTRPYHHRFGSKASPCASHTGSQTGTAWSWLQGTQPGSAGTAIPNFPAGMWYPGWRCRMTFLAYRDGTASAGAQNVLIRLGPLGTVSDASLMTTSLANTDETTNRFVLDIQYVDTNTLSWTAITGFGVATTNGAQEQTSTNWSPTTAKYLNISGNNTNGDTQALIYFTTEIL